MPGFYQLRSRITEPAAIALLLAALALPSGAVTRHTAPSVDKNAEAQRMAAQAYDLTKALDPLHRALVLQRLLFVPPAAATSSQRIKWAEELYQTAPLIPPERDDKRLLAESSAAQLMARYDVDRAFAMLDAIEPGDLEHFPDRRAQAAGPVFNQVMLSLGSAGVPLIRKHARSYAEAGVYPYLAVLPALHAAEKSGQADAIFKEACEAFQRGTDNLFGIHSFALFADLARQHVTPALVNEGAVNALGTLAQWGEKHPDLLADDPEGTHAAIRSAFAHTLRLLQRLIPETYADFAQAHPDYVALRKAVPSTPGTLVSSNTPDAEVPLVNAAGPTAITEAAEAMRHAHAIHSSTQEAAAISEGIAAIDSRVQQGACGECFSPEVAASLFVRNAAQLSPGTIRVQLAGISDPYQHAVLLVSALEAMLEPPLPGHRAKPKKK